MGNQTKYEFYRTRHGVCTSGLYAHSGIMSQSSGVTKVKIRNAINDIVKTKAFKLKGIDGLKESTRQTLEIYLSALNFN